jgi:hypothetical protein
MAMQRGQKKKPESHSCLPHAQYMAENKIAGRYIVIPMRPEGSESLSEEELVGLVTRDSMIGVCALPAYKRGE